MEIFEWDNITFANNLGAKEEYERLLESNKNSLTSTVQYHKLACKCHELLTKIKPNIKTIPFLAGLDEKTTAAFLSYIEEAVSASVRNKVTAEEDIHYYERDISRCNDHLSAINEALSDVSTPRVSVDKVHVISQIESIPAVVNGSVELEKEGNSPLLSWEFSNLFYTPSEPNLEVTSRVDFNDLPISIPIGSVYVSVNLQTSVVNISGTFPKERYPYIFSYEHSPHPHVLVGEPCMGDFAGPFVEAINDKDWMLAVMLIQSFLEHANTGDSAGRNWKSFFLSFLQSEETMTQEESGLYIIHHIDDTSSVHPLCKLFLNLPE